MPTQHLTLNIRGMTCQACANRIEKVLNKKEFIQSATVNFAGETAQIEFDNSRTTPDELIQIIEKTGFQAALPSTQQPENDHETHWRMWTLLVMAAPFMWGMLGMMFGSHAMSVLPYAAAPTSQNRARTRCWSNRLSNNWRTVY